MSSPKPNESDLTVKKVFELLKPTQTRYSIDQAYALGIAAKAAYFDEPKIKGSAPDPGRVKFISSPRKEKDHYTDTQLFIAYTDDATVIAFRGTQEPKDWITDAKFEKDRDDANGNGAKIHHGFLTAIESVWPSIVDWIAERQLQNKPLWIAGHSLGGALAALAADRALSLGWTVNGLYTYGQPRVGNKRYIDALAGKLSGRYFRFVNNKDIVTRVPPRKLRYEHGGAVCIFDAAGNLFADAAGQGKWNESLDSDDIDIEETSNRQGGKTKVVRIWNKLKSKIESVDDRLTDHFMDNYLWKMDKNRQ